MVIVLPRKVGMYSSACLYWCYIANNSCQTHSYEPFSPSLLVTIGQSICSTFTSAFLNGKLERSLLITFPAVLSLQVIRYLDYSFIQWISSLLSLQNHIPLPRYTYNIWLEHCMWCKIRPTNHQRSLFPQTASNEWKTSPVSELCMMCMMCAWYICDMSMICLRYNYRKHIVNISCMYQIHDCHMQEYLVLAGMNLIGAVIMCPCSVDLNLESVFLLECHKVHDFHLF